MRVVIVFSDYQSAVPSGEREMVRNECAALARAGVDVHLVTAATDEGLTRPLYAVRAAGRVATGFGAFPLQRVLEVDPHIVHVHNLFPNFGTRWLSGLNLPLVATLHNYRPVCVQGSLFREGAPCTLCPDGAKWSALRHRCYRGSVSASLPLALANRRGLRGNPLIEKANRIFLPSDFHRDMLLGYGLDANRSLTSPNFVPDREAEEGDAEGADRAGWVYIGRLDEGKGILDLVKSWPTSERLVVIGDGPSRREVAREAGKSVELIGQQPRGTVDRYLQSSEGLIFPSRHFESQALVSLEALRAGTPIVAREGTAVAATVRKEKTGHVYSHDRDIAQALWAIRRDAPALTLRCRWTFKQRYSESVWRERRCAEYRDLLASCGT